MIIQVLFGGLAIPELWEITKEHLQGVERRLGAFLDILAGLSIPVLIGLELVKVVVFGVLYEQPPNTIAAMVPDNGGIWLDLPRKGVSVLRREIGTAHSRSQLNRVSKALLDYSVGLTDLAKLAMSVMALRVELLPC